LKKSKEELCYLCGKSICSEEKNRDHVPPRCFFPNHNRNGYSGNLVVVPSHKVCNSKWGKSQDEKFRNYILGILPNKNEHAHEIWSQGVLNSFQNSDVGRKKKKSFISKLSDRTEGECGEIITEPHLLLTEEAFIGPLQRIVRGLYYKQCAQVLPEDAIIDFRAPDNNIALDADDFNRKIDEMVRHGLYFKFNEPYKNVFRWAILRDDSSSVSAGVCVSLFFMNL